MKNVRMLGRYTDTWSFTRLGGVSFVGFEQLWLDMDPIKNSPPGSKP